MIYYSGTDLLPDCDYLPQLVSKLVELQSCNMRGVRLAFTHLGMHIYANLVNEISELNDLHAKLEVKLKADRKNE